MKIPKLHSVHPPIREQDSPPGGSVDIDKLLAKIWPEAIHPLPRILLYQPSGRVTASVELYAQYICDLLGGQLNHFQAKTKTDSDLDNLVQEAKRDYDLVIYREPRPSFIKRFIDHPPCCQAIKRLPTSVLVVRQPRRPLRNILLVTRGQVQDNIAVEWLAHLAQPREMTVTVLTILPSTPAMYSEALRNYGLKNWLKATIPLGQQLRYIAQQLPDWEYSGKLRFRPGSTGDQIECEVEESDPDLIIIAGDAHKWLERRIMGALIDPLLHWIDRPVLVAKPIAKLTSSLVTHSTSYRKA